MAAVLAPLALAGANPTIPFYGSSGVITATPYFPIVGENTLIEVVVGNTGDAEASNVQVKVSFNDWGVTFSGWQEIDTVLIPTIPAGDTVTVSVNNVFQNRAHTCLEAVIVSADENVNVDDDRGQINLEVISAGETFPYEVPVRNEGELPLHLLIQGQCQPKGDPAGTVGEFPPCKEVRAEVVLGPGEEILVPVVLDLRGVPVGQQVAYVLEAVDLGTGERNHVEIRVVRETARHLKEQAVATLNSVAGQTVERPWRNRIQTAARHIQLALQSRAWVDSDRVRKAGGAQIFAQESATVKELLALLETGLPLSLKTQLNQVVLDLVDADRILARSASVDAGSPPLAEDLIRQADAARRSGDFVQAITAAGKAWQAAQR